jgi:hypothetical protein
MKYDHPITLGVMAAWLKTGRVLDHAASLALVLTLLALHPMAGLREGWPNGWGVAVWLALALMEKYYAWRVALDAGLFDLLAQTGARDMGQFDASMAAFLRPGAASMPPRSMESRFMGARRLFLWQVAALLMQVLVGLALFLL